MSNSAQSRMHWAVACIGLCAFVLPLTLLFPGPSVWASIPKVRVTRLHAVSYQVTWSQLNSTMVALVVLLFCLFLELRKRKLDDIVESVLTVCEITDATTDAEKATNETAMESCLRLLDANTEHYENLALLRDDLRRREANAHDQLYPYSVRQQQPPIIEPSDTDLAFLVLAR